MSVKSDAIVAAATAVRQDLWEEWRSGRTHLRSSEVIESIRQIRVKAGCTEENLPGSLKTVLELARAKDTKTIKLSELLMPLNKLAKPAA